MTNKPLEERLKEKLEDLKDLEQENHTDKIEEELAGLRGDIAKLMEERGRPVVVKNYRRLSNALLGSVAILVIGAGAVLIPYFILSNLPANKNKDTDIHLPNADAVPGSPQAREQPFSLEASPIFEKYRIPFMDKPVYRISETLNLTRNTVMPPGEIELKEYCKIISHYDLTIQPGTTITFHDDSGIFLRWAKLTARGTDKSKILLKPSKEEGVSANILVDKGSADLEWCLASGMTGKKINPEALEFKDIFSEFDYWLRTEAFMSFNKSHVQMRNCAVLGSKNRAIYLHEGSLSMDHCRLEGNSINGEGIFSDKRGAGISLYNSESATFNYCVFDGNTADDGAAVYMHNKRSTRVIFENCAIINNVASFSDDKDYSRGNALSADSGIVGLRGCRILNNRSGILVMYNGTIVVNKDCEIKGNTRRFFTGANAEMKWVESGKND
jgi:hypothetical protein